MSVSTVTAARILKGQMNGKTGEETKLAMDEFPHVALSRVSWHQWRTLCPPSPPFRFHLLVKKNKCC